MKSYRTFLESVPGFEDFFHISEDKYFLEVPEDWALILTDIKGSTKAVQAGRYQDVNMVGAAGITALLNEFNDRDLPFVFGGDGATLLVPPEFKSKATQALRRVQRWSEKEFGLELRGHLFELRELYGEGDLLLLGKHRLSQGNQIYQFRGGALKKAEEKMKSGSGGFAVLPLPAESDPNLQGLSCRWEPLTATKGLILTILVSAKDDSTKSFAAYREVLAGLQNILGGDFRVACPVKNENMKIKWPPRTLRAEASARRGNHLGRLWSTAVDSLIAYLMLRFDISGGGFDPRRYKKEMISNSDFQKFDDLLRMVLDCTESQAKEIEALLKSFEERGDITFGTHRSDQALMTCLVFSSTQNQHLHFIDGAQGGYTLAAVSLKNKKAT